MLLHTQKIIDIVFSISLSYLVFNFILNLINLNNDLIKLIIIITTSIYIYHIQLEDSNI